MDDPVPLGRGIHDDGDDPDPQELRIRDDGDYVPNSEHLVSKNHLGVVQN